MTESFNQNTKGNYFNNVVSPVYHLLIPTIYQRGQEEEYYYQGGEFYHYYDTPYGYYTRYFYYVEDQIDNINETDYSPVQASDESDDED